MICEPDKTRFCDPEALTDTYLVHSIDLSDERSTSQFVTLWVKGHDPRVSAWKQQHELDDHHARDVYHRDAPWLPTTYPGMHRKGWSTHYHIDLLAPPTWQDIEPFIDELPPAIQEAVKAHLAKDSAHV